MANTRFINKTIEPYIRKWLGRRFPGAGFVEKSVQIGVGRFAFDGVSSNGRIVAQFLCSRATTATRNENTGAVRKALNDLQYLESARGAKKRLMVFTDQPFLELIQKRTKRRRAAGIQFLHCKLPATLARGLIRTLDECSVEQKGRPYA